MKFKYAIIISLIVISGTTYAAPSIDDLQATIQKLLLQVQQLQQQIQQKAANSAVSTTAAQTPPIKKTISFCLLGELKYGETSDSVVLLQTILKKTGDYPQGLITGYYGPLTRAAVIHFQK